MRSGSISHQMIPKALTELGLIEAIEDMLNKSLGINKIDYHSNVLVYMKG